MDNVKKLKAISDPTRLKIIELLLKKKYCVTALAKNLEISEPAVSQHLKVLSESGLVSGEKIGYFMHYDIKRDALRKLAKEIDNLANTVCEPCEHMKSTQIEPWGQNYKRERCPEIVQQNCHGKKVY